MGAYQLNLCGFEKPYMQKLSIYLKKQMGEQMQIGVWDEVPASVPDHAEDRAAVIWLGDEACVKRLSGESAGEQSGNAKPGKVCFLTLSPRQTDDRADRIYAYQSADIILDFLLRHAEQIQKADENVPAVAPCMEVFLDIGERRSLLVCGMAYAQEKGAGQRLLLVDMIPCSGLTGMLALDAAKKDAADLILALRRKQPVSMTDYVVHAGNVDVLPAACNPLVLYELLAEDMKLLLTQIAHISRYDAVVVLAGTPFPGIGYLFAAARRTICLQDEGVCSVCRKDELLSFYEHSGGKMERWKDAVLVPDAGPVAEEAGMHLLAEWTNGPFAEALHRLLEG